MCKIMIFTNLSKIKNNKKLVDTCQELLSSQRDGFGYVYQTEADGLSGQRTNDIESFEFNSNNEGRLYPWSVTTEGISNSFGDVTSRLVGAGMFHGRISTNNKALVNVHPLTFDNRSYLIHNGVVSNIGPSYKQVTSNDTEHLLHYMDRAGGIESLAKNITGYYALGYLTQDGVLTVARDKIAPLVSSYIPKLDTYIFATNEALISDFCAEFKVKHDVIESVMSDTCLVFRGNDLVSMSSFKSLGYGQKEASLAGLSLGYSLDKWSEEADDFGDADYLGFLAANITPNDYIELDKTQITYEKFKSLSNDAKSRCEVYNLHGENLLDLWVNEDRKKRSA